LLHDGSRLGFTSLRDWRPISSTSYRPSTGPGSVRRIGFDRAWAIFTGQARALPLLVVLQNTPVSKSAEQLGLSPVLAMQRLVEALDAMAAHFEIREGKRAA
jgi:hypothetical protein